MAFVLFTRALPAWHAGHHLGGVGSALLRQRAATTLSHPDDAWELSPSWRDALSDQLAEPYFTELQQFVEAERRANTVLPSREDQFAAFAACDFERVRVVILGQDPYPTPGHAHGLAFSVLPTVQPLPGSLRNIYREIQEDVGVAPASHGCLRAWSAQGVLLLNAVLSVRAGERQSHAKRGWETFTDAVVQRLASRRDGLVFLLWGRAAQERGRLIDSSAHLVLHAAHPSPLAASKGFFGCRHFSQANAYLVAAGHEPIDWTIDAASSSTAAASAESKLPPSGAKTREALAGSAGASGGAPPGSVTVESPDMAIEKLSLRVRQGLLHIVDLEASHVNPADDDWSTEKGLSGLAAYAVRPGKGGYRYLRNVQFRLAALGFSYDAATATWLQPKRVATDGRSASVSWLIELALLRADVGGATAPPTAPPATPSSPPSPTSPVSSPLTSTLTSIAASAAPSAQPAPPDAALDAVSDAARAHVSDSPGASVGVGFDVGGDGEAGGSLPPSLLAATRLVPSAAEAVVRAARDKHAQPLVMPPRLSPSSISAFRSCPQLFLFRYLWKLPEPTSAVLTKGILVHSTLERMFDLPPAERASRLHDTLRDEWRRLRTRPEYAALFPTVAAEREWGLQCLKLLDNYAAFEDPASPPDETPLIEAWLQKRLYASSASDAPGTAGGGLGGGGGIKLVGKADRIDGVRSVAGGAGQQQPITIVDYKTGKAPSLKYSAAKNAEIKFENFFQLRCYALLLARGDRPKGLDAHRPVPKARRLRLLYLADGDEGRGATPVDEELPLDDAAQYEAMLDATEAEVVETWRQMHALVTANDPSSFTHCDRSFCQCHDMRPLVHHLTGWFPE